MDELNRINGIAGLKKHKMKITTIICMIYALVAAGAFGIEDMISMSGPGLMIAMPLIVLSYVLPTLAGLASVGSWEQWATEGEGTVGYVDVLLQNSGPVFGVVFLVVLILSQASMFNAYFASGSRGFFSPLLESLFIRSWQFHYGFSERNTPLKKGMESL